MNLPGVPRKAQVNRFELTDDNDVLAEGLAGFMRNELEVAVILDDPVLDELLEENPIFESIGSRGLVGMHDKVYDRISVNGRRIANALSVLPDQDDVVMKFDPTLRLKQKANPGRGYGKNIGRHIDDWTPIDEAVAGPGPVMYSHFSLNEPAKLIAGKATITQNPDGLSIFCEDTDVADAPPEILRRGSIALFVSTGTERKHGTYHEVDTVAEDVIRQYTILGLAVDSPARRNWDR